MILYYTNSILLSWVAICAWVILCLSYVNVTLIPCC